jgi:hypothetical protein
MSKRGNKEALTRTRAELGEVLTRYETDRVWDTIQAKDLDPKLMSWVGECLIRGQSPDHVAMNLGFSGKTSKQWKKIAAYFRGGFRADAEAYLYHQTKELLRTIDGLKKIVEDSIENGTPHVVTYPAGKGQGGSCEVIRVKGATRELAGIVRAYAEAIKTPVALWKDFGAIGDKGGGPQGVTIQVLNNIRLPSAEEIREAQQKMIDRAKSIELRVGELK